MSSRARRLEMAATPAGVLPVVSWLETVADGAVPAAGRRAAQRVTAGAAAAVLPPLNVGPASTPPPAQLEQEIFAKAYAQGQQAGAAAVHQETAQLAQKLAATL